MEDLQLSGGDGSRFHQGKRAGGGDEGSSWRSTSSRSAYDRNRRPIAIASYRTPLAT
jgi:hypothetical protein